MRTSLLVLCFLISLNSNSQGLHPDSLERKIHIAWDYGVNLDFEASIRVFDEIIEADSMHYEVYYLRGYTLLYLADTVYYGMNNPFDTVVTHCVARAIRDLDKAIQLKKSDHGGFPSTTFTEGINSFICDTTPNMNDLSAPAIQNPEKKDIFMGFLILLSDADDNSDLACFLWRRASKRYEMIVSMIEKYCR